MAVSITCTRIFQSGDKWYVRWSDKSENEFSSLADVKDFVRDRLSRDALKAIGLAKWMEVNPTGSNPALLIGKTITADLSLAANLVRIT